MTNPPRHPPDRAAREERFRALFAEHHPPVLAFAQRRTHPDRAEDIAADTFLVAWRRLDDVPTRAGEALPWLYAVARHCLLNAHRAAGRHEALGVRITDAAARGGAGSGLGPSGLPSTENVLDEDALALRADLSAAWHRLSSTDQEVLGLALFEDLTSAHAATVLGISPTAYRLRLSRARRTLRRELDLQPSPTHSSGRPTVSALPNLQETQP